MRIQEESLRFWGLFGYKLGRMEFIWDRKFPETKAAFDGALKELMLMLGSDFEPDQNSYRDFSNSILLHYQRENPEIFSCILIGISIQRNQLAISVKDVESKKMLVDLAKSALASLPAKLVPDKGLLFTAITLAKDSPFPDVCNEIMEALNIMNEPDKERQQSSKGSLPVNKVNENYLFISYSSKDRNIAEFIRDQLQANQISCWIAPDSIPIGSEYTEVIVDAIENSCGVLLVLSSNSQESKWVPKEIDIAVTASKVVFPIHIDHSELNKRMRFRLSNAQVFDAYEQLAEKLPEVIRVIKSNYNSFS